MLVDFGFYQNEYSGEVSATDFEPLERQASSIIAYYTFNRASKADNNVKFAVCELIDYLASLKATGGKEVANETVGTHSVTYMISKDGRDPVKAKQKEIMRKYLGHTGLLYRGR